MGHYFLDIQYNRSRLFYLNGVEAPKAARDPVSGGLNRESVVAAAGASVGGFSGVDCGFKHESISCFADLLLSVQEVVTHLYSKLLYEMG